MSYRRRCPHARTTRTVMPGATELIEQAGWDAVMVTRGGEGMTMIEAETEPLHPHHGTEVYDVAGAGDTVIAVLAAGLG